MAKPSFDPQIYKRLPGLVLGFHGCDEAVGMELLSGGSRHLKPSKNKYDWLGDGVYFWENDPQRAWEFAEESMKKKHLTKGNITKPFVIGAVIDLGFCLNLLDRIALDELSDAYKSLESFSNKVGDVLPKNDGENFGARFLDRAVIETLHRERDDLNEQYPGQFPPYESVRSAFREGGSLYDNSGFQDKNHIQIAIRNLACIKGYFRPL